VIPPLERSLFKQDVACALELGEAGHAKLGYHILDHALAEVEALELGWAPELADRYRLALVLFAEGHGLGFGPPSGAEPVPQAATQSNAELRESAAALRESCVELRALSVRVRAQAQAVREESRLARQRRQATLVEV